MKKLLNKEIVEQAIRAIQGSGNKVTIERIRAITGGSPKTIIAIKRLIDDSEHDSNYHSALSSNDNGHDSKHDHVTLPNDSDNDNLLSLNSIRAMINDSVDSRLENFKSDLFMELKKNELADIEKFKLDNERLKSKVKQLERLCDPDDREVLFKNAKQIGLLQKQLQFANKQTEAYMDKVDFLADSFRTANSEKSSLESDLNICFSDLASERTKNKELEAKSKKQKAECEEAKITLELKVKELEKLQQGDMFDADGDATVNTTKKHTEAPELLTPKLEQQIKDFAQQKNHLAIVHIYRSLPKPVPFSKIILKLNKLKLFSKAGTPFDQHNLRNSYNTFLKKMPA